MAKVRIKDIQNWTVESSFGRPISKQKAGMALDAVRGADFEDDAEFNAEKKSDDRKKG